jgi:type IV pilus assembly protein PilM
MATTQKSARPRLACEISSERVIAARISANSGRVEVYANRKLSPGTVMPGLTSSNVADTGALQEALASALESVSSGHRDVVLVIPDAAVRVLLLDFDTLPQKAEEAAQIIRFRLRKSLPFDVETAALSYQAERRGSTVRVVAALSPKEVIGEYENAVRAAGFMPGVVVPSSLASLGLVDAVRPTMLVRVDAASTTVAIADGDQLLLVRTLEHPGQKLNAAELGKNVYPSMVFYQDNYSSQIEKVLLTGPAENPELASALQKEMGISTEELGASLHLGDSLGEPLPQSMLTAVAGALLS